MYLSLWGIPHLGNYEVFMKVLTGEQIKCLEKSAVDNGLFSYIDLMKNAGSSVVDIICKRYNVSGRKVCVISGSGNNGGDGLVIADLLRNEGAFVTLYLPFGTPCTDTSKSFYDNVSDIPVVKFVDDNYDFYIDALFGIGLNRLLATETEELINRLNQFGGIKIAVDIPSGLFADGGIAQIAFKADLTVTFIGYKLSQLLPETSDYCGEVIVSDIGIKTDGIFSYKTIEPPKQKLFNKNSHKGTFGTAVLFCGSYGMCGAEILAAKSALISGAGIIKAIVCDKNYSAFTSAVPEAVTVPVETALSGAPILYDKTVLSAISKSSSILIGCGIGQSDEANLLVKKVLSFANVPTVIDADGINAVARNIDILRNITTPLVFTPHPGEMARLMNTTVSDVEKHRVEYAKKFACGYNCVLVLKGANTIVASPEGEVYFNTNGNYGMAKGGSGDVLAGIIVSLLANGCHPLEASLTAVYLHGEAGDRAAKRFTGRTMTPSDIIEELKFISF